MEIDFSNEIVDETSLLLPSLLDDDRQSTLKDPRERLITHIHVDSTLEGYRWLDISCLALKTAQIGQLVLQLTGQVDNRWAW